MTVVTDPIVLPGLRLVERLAALVIAIEWPRLKAPRRPPPRVSEHLLRDLGLTPAEYDGL